MGLVYACARAHAREHDFKKETDCEGGQSYINKGLKFKSRLQGFLNHHMNKYLTVLFSLDINQILFFLLLQTGQPSLDQEKEDHNREDVFCAIWWYKTKSTK